MAGFARRPLAWLRRERSAARCWALFPRRFFYPHIITGKRIPHEYPLLPQVKKTTVVHHPHFHFPVVFLLLSFALSQPPGFFIHLLGPLHPQPFMRTNFVKLFPPLVKLSLVVSQIAVDFSLQFLFHVPMHPFMPSVLVGTLDLTPSERHKNKHGVQTGRRNRWGKRARNGEITRKGLRPGRRRRRKRGKNP
jgi:hypothetical protein